MVWQTRDTEPMRHRRMEKGQEKEEERWIQRWTERSSQVSVCTYLRTRCGRPVVCVRRLWRYGDTAKRTSRWHERQPSQRAKDPAGDTTSPNLRVYLTRSCLDRYKKKKKRAGVGFVHGSNLGRPSCRISILLQTLPPTTPHNNPLQKLPLTTFYNTTLAAFNQKKKKKKKKGRGWVRARQQPGSAIVSYLNPPPNVTPHHPP
jgi:hypothetical protein